MGSWGERWASFGVRWDVRSDKSIETKKIHQLTRQISGHPFNRERFLGNFYRWPFFRGWVSGDFLSAHFFSTGPFFQGLFSRELSYRVPVLTLPVVGKLYGFFKKKNWGWFKELNICWICFINSMKDEKRLFFITSLTIIWLSMPAEWGESSRFFTSAWKNAVGK